MKSKIRRLIHSISRDVRDSLQSIASPPTLVVLERLLAGQDLSRLNDAVAYATDLRQCIEPLKCGINILKRPEKLNGPSDAAFVALADLLKAVLPPCRWGKR